jgi:hypothetical protein
MSSLLAFSFAVQKLLNVMKDRKVKQFLLRDLYQWERGGHKEWVKEGKCDENTIYSCIKMEQRDLLKLF